MSNKKLDTKDHRDEHFRHYDWKHSSDRRGSEGEQERTSKRKYEKDQVGVPYTQLPKEGIPSTSVDKQGRSREQLTGGTAGRQREQQQREDWKDKSADQKGESKGGAVESQSNNKGQLSTTGDNNSIPKSYEKVIRSETKTVDGKPQTRSILRTREYYTDPSTGKLVENVDEHEIPQEEAQREFSEMSNDFKTLNAQFADMQRDMVRLQRACFGGRGFPSLLDWDRGSQNQLPWNDRSQDEQHRGGRYIEEPQRRQGQQSDDQQRLERFGQHHDDYQRSLQQQHHERGNYGGEQERSRGGFYHNDQGRDDRNQRRIQAERQVEEARRQLEHARSAYHKVLDEERESSRNREHNTRRF
jgi:hypothetical protein